MGLGPFAGVWETCQASDHQKKGFLPESIRILPESATHLLGMGPRDHLPRIWTDLILFLTSLEACEGHVTKF